MCGRPSQLPQSSTLFLPLLQTELEKGRVAGPFPFPPFPSSYPDLHVSRCGVIPKKNQPGKWCLILYLSSLSGRTVNDGIPKEDFSVHYMKVDDIISGIMARSRGSLMAKFDVESAYRIVPIHPGDLHLLGMEWRDYYFVDMALPFGLRSAPFIFSAIANVVEWILVNNYGIELLDDFHTLPGGGCSSRVGVPVDLKLGRVLLGQSNRGCRFVLGDFKGPSLDGSSAVLVVVGSSFLLRLHHILC